MSLYDFIGVPQLAALLVLGQRGLEELHSARNTRRLMASGAAEVGSTYYPIVAATHLAWIAGLFFLIPPSAPIIWPLIAYYLVLQVLRYWVIVSLGPFWTHRIITLPGAPIARSGPYRYLSHPNYALTIIETFVLPLAFGALALATIMTALWWVVLGVKIKLEDEALAARHLSQRSTAAK
jgi:methyltransferase